MLKKYFYKENSNVTLDELLTKEFDLWIDTQSSTSNTFQGSGRTVGKEVLLQIENTAESCYDDLIYHVLSFEIAVSPLESCSPDEF